MQGHLQMHKVYIDVIRVVAYEVGLANVSTGIYNSLILWSSGDWGLVLRMCQKKRRRRGGAEQGVESKVNPVRFSITWSDEWTPCLRLSLSLSLQGIPLITGIRGTYKCPLLHWVRAEETLSPFHWLAGPHCPANEKWHTITKARPQTCQRWGERHLWVSRRIS